MSTTYDPNAVNQAIVDFVRLGHEVSLNWTVVIPNRATLAAAMGALRHGNEFDPVKIAETFGEIFDEASTVEFGREGSEVLYVGIPYTSQQRNGTRGGTSVRLPDEDRIAFAQRVMDWAEVMGADEITAEQRPSGAEPVWNAPGERPSRVRIWWD